MLDNGEEVDDELRTILLMGGLSSEIEMLKRMIIPEKYRHEVAISLQRIKNEISSPEYAEKLLPDSVLSTITAET